MVSRATRTVRGDRGDRLLLTEGLVARGMDVTLFASGDSTTTATHVHVFDEAPSERIGETFWELTMRSSA